MKASRADVFSTRNVTSDDSGHSIAAKLIEIAHHLCVAAPAAGLFPEQVPAEEIDAPSVLVRRAEEELRRRRLRAQHLPCDLFGEGAWNMLLDLFVCHHRRIKVSTMSACIAADIPERTALSSLEMLERRGLVERSPCDHDKRVKYVSLTEQGYAAMRALLSSYRD